MEIVVGAADPIVPPGENAQFFAANSKSAKLTVLPGGVGHYTFLDACTEAGKKQLVDREAVHRQVAAMAAQFFEK